MSGTCILCGAGSVEMVLDLGETALANKFLAPADLDGEEPIHPLRLGRCGACGHVQLIDHVPPPAMFDDYLYVSSASETLVGHLRGLAKTVTERLGRAGFVVDIGCNDGTLLAGFRDQGHEVLGIDPARNLLPLAQKAGVEVETAYFGAETAARMAESRGRADVVTLTNVFPHIQDLDDLLAGFDALLKDDGTIVIEAHYLLDMLEQLAFDTIYHEHVSYWSLGAAAKLFERGGFEVVDCERLPIHHGQMRMFVRRKGMEPPTARVAAAIEAEADLDLEAFAAGALKVRAELTGFLETCKADGRTVAGYGAPAKGNTLLSFLGLGADALPWIADVSTLKQGRFTPGTRIPVVAPERILEEQPDYLMILAWNFVDEIMGQQAEYDRRGGRFVTPVPELRILSS